MKKLFNDLNMSWKNVILFAIAAAVITAVLNLIPGLYDTSFTDIAVSFEWWIIFAIIIVSNCKKTLEAGLKVFVFFLISQPLIYAIEMIFIHDNLFKYYLYWFIWTLLTFPGGMIAYQINRKDVIGSIILAIGLIMLNAPVISTMFTNELIYVHWITFIVCIIFTIICILNFCPSKKLKAICAVCVIIGVSVISIYSYRVAYYTSGNTIYELESNHTYTCKIISDGDAISDDNEGISATIEQDTYNDSYYVNITYSKCDSEAHILVSDEDNNSFIIYVEVDAHGGVTMTKL